MKISFTIILIGLLIPISPLIAQESNHIIGFGSGVHYFTGSDDFNNEKAKTSDSKQGEIKNATPLIIYYEFKLNQSFLLGLQYQQLQWFRQTRSETEGYNDGSLSEQITITTTLLTLTWLHAKKSGPGRFGLIIGTGPSSYEYQAEQEASSSSDGGSSFSAGSETYNTTGTANLLGGFYQIGNDGFSGRLGLNLFQTQFSEGIEVNQSDNHSLLAFEEENSTLHVDGSGFTLYFSMQYAF